ncbi:MAG: histidine kinase, partial [Bacteroidia bacterium]|nr:histidine kinase [Bacteroidia bacterium]
AIQDYFKMLGYATETGDTKKQMIALTRIGRCYEDLGNDAPALVNYRKAFDLGNLINDKIQQVYICNSIASVYLKKKNSDSVLKYLSIGFKIAKESGNPNALYAINNGYGLFYSQNGDPEKAIGFFNEAVKLIQKTFPGSDFEAGVYINLGAAYLSMNDVERSEKFLTKALQLSQKNHHPQNVSEIFQNLAELSARKKNFKKAYDYLSSFSSLKDSLVTLDNNKKIAEMQAVYDLKQKEQEITSSRVSNFLKTKNLFSANRQVNRGLFLFAVLLLILSVTYLFLTKTKKVNRVLAEQEKLIEQQQGVIRENHFLLARYETQMSPHFIFNSLNGIQHLVVSGKKEELVQRLNLLEDLMKMHFQNTGINGLSLAKEMRFLKSYLDIEMLRFSNYFEFDFEIDKGLDSESLLIPPMIIQPFLENSINHGLLPKINGGKIRVLFSLFSSDGIDCLKCEISDNGIGRKAAAINAEKKRSTHKSKAIEIIQNRIRLYWDFAEKRPLNPLAIADLTDSNDNSTGTCVTVLFPLILVKNLV